MVSDAVELALQGPGVVYVIVYVFNALAERSISPVDVLMNTIPAGDALNVPPGVPVTVGVGSAPDWQKVLAG